MVGSGEHETGLEKFAEGFELYRGLATPPVFWPALLMIHAKALHVAERPGEALGVIGEAESLLHSGDPVEADLLIVHGDLILDQAPSDASTAAAMFERAVAIAGPRGAWRLAQVQALTRLAVLLRGTASEHEARDALQLVYDGLTEGFDLPHRRGARR